MKEKDLISQYNSIDSEIKKRGKHKLALNTQKWAIDNDIINLERIISEELGEDVSLKYLKNKNTRINSNRNNRIIRNTLGILSSVGVTYGLSKYNVDFPVVIGSGILSLIFTGNVLKDCFKSVNEYRTLYKLYDGKILNKLK
jgi:hypothetical protein